MSERVQHDEQYSSLHDRWRFLYDKRCSSLHAEELKNVLEETEILAELCCQVFAYWIVLKCSQLRHCEGRRISWHYIKKKKSTEVLTLSNKI